MHTAIEYALVTVRDWAPAGRPMWPLPASSLYNLFLEGLTEGLRVAVVIRDASPFGWGAVSRQHPAQNGVPMIGTFATEAADDMEFQVRRKTRGVLAFRAALQQFNLHGWTVILRNDAVGALSALAKGCARSPYLQDQAMEFTTLARNGAKGAPR